MNVVIKRRIVNFSSDILAITSLIVAFFCLFWKIRGTFSSCVDNINLLAAKSIFSRGRQNIFFNIKNNLSFEENNYIEVEEDDTTKGSDKNLISPSTTNLPEFSEDSLDEEESNHLNEAKYKIIESQFSSGGIKFENFYVKNTTGVDIDIGLELSKKPEFDIVDTTEPQVLIFHTHTSESYMRSDKGFFYESFYPRSLNNSKNVTRVGQAITDKLIENGINTIHDITYHDNPTYNGSYLRAANTIQNNLEKYPSIKVVIDIHRDSLGTKETGKIKPTFRYQGKKAAQLMIISGCDPDNSLGFPNWIKNLRFALKVQKYCESLFPGITRPLNLSKVKYNQHITPGSLLIEIGSDVNTLEEAVYTGSMLGETLSKLLNDLKK